MTKNAIFNILCFFSTRRFADELVEKLNRGGKKAILTMIGRDDLFSVDKQMNDIDLFNVLLLSKDDMSSVVPLDSENNNDAQPYNLLLVCIDTAFAEMSSAVRSYPSVISVSSSIEQIRMEIIDFYKKNLKGNTVIPFVGRTQEIDQFQNLLYSERYLTTKSVIISGHIGVGREAFARECIRISAGRHEKEPCLISMAENGNIEIFIVQLNSILQSYDETGIKALLGKENEEKVNAAVSMLNRIISFGRYVIVYDDAKTCIRYDRKLADWFKEVIGSPELIGGLHLFVISTISLNYSRAKFQDGVAFFTLYDLSRMDRKKMIYHRLTELGKVAPEEDVNYILDSSVYAPQMLISVIDDYCGENQGIAYVKSHMGEYLSVSDSKLRSLILKYKESDETDLWNLLILLSQIEYLSRDVLGVIFKDTFDIVLKHLDMLIANGLVERFGDLDEYYRLDSSVSDNIRRNKDKSKEPDFQGHVDEMMSRIISRNPKITEDYSVYLYKVKDDLKHNRKDVEALLIPSIVISSIIASYDNRFYDRTLELCDWVLEEKPHYFDNVYREVRYWKCSALCRLKDGRFFESVDYFKYDADYHFLMGFMYRIKREYARAEYEYRSALQQNPSFGRAKRELVTALLGQHKFSEAFNLAKDNYERDSENTYHLLAYYRCLVRKNNLSFGERQDIERLLKEAKELFTSDYFCKGMQFEYDRFIGNKSIGDLWSDANKLEQIGYDNNVQYLIDIVSEFNVSRGVESTIKLTDLDEELDK